MIHIAAIELQLNGWPDTRFGNHQEAVSYPHFLMLAHLSGRTPNVRSRARASILEELKLLPGTSMSPERHLWSRLTFRRRDDWRELVGREGSVSGSHPCIYAPDQTFAYQPLCDKQDFRQGQLHDCLQSLVATGAISIDAGAFALYCETTAVLIQSVKDGQAVNAATGRNCANRWNCCRSPGQNPVWPRWDRIRQLSQIHSLFGSDFGESANICAPTFNKKFQQPINRCHLRIKNIDRIATKIAICRAELHVKLVKPSGNVQRKK